MNDFEKEVLREFLSDHWREFLTYLDEHYHHTSATTDAAVYNSIINSLTPENKETQNG